MQSLLPAAHRIAALLKTSGETLAVAESSTGGLLSAALLAVPGASAFFVSGAVVYTRTARAQLMGITDQNMHGLRSSSEPYALLLARTARTRFGTTWGLAETGAAGPTGNRYGDAAGHTCLAVAGPNGETATTLETQNTNRETNMHAFAAAALALLEQRLKPEG